MLRPSCFFSGVFIFLCLVFFKILLGQCPFFSSFSLSGLIGANDKGQELYFMVFYHLFGRSKFSDHQASKHHHCLAFGVENICNFLIVDVTLRYVMEQKRFIQRWMLLGLAKKTKILTISFHFRAGGCY